MSSKCEWLCIIPDKAGSSAKRLECRSEHLKGISELAEASNNVKIGGVLLKDKPAGDDPSAWDFYGSTIVYEAESREECLELLRKDIYSTEGVWDVTQAQVWPMKLGRRAL